MFRVMKRRWLSCGSVMHERSSLLRVCGREGSAETLPRYLIRSGPEVHGHPRVTRHELRAEDISI